MLKDGSKREKESLLAGLDEVGRGCLSGPLCIAVAAFPKDYPRIAGVDDSKKLSEKKRLHLAPIIVREASYIGIGWATPKQVDDMGINHAWQFAAEQALQGIPHTDLLLVDGIDAVSQYDDDQETVVKGDSKHWQIGAASIIAKVSRDIHMADMGEYFPEYLWSKNKGYGSKEHRDAILEHGVCYYHRMSFLQKNKEMHKQVLAWERRNTAN